jgi:carboxyl-terminal processing protease
MAIIVIVFVLGAAFGSQFSTSFAQNGGALSQDEETAFEPLYETFNLISDQFIEPPEKEKLVDGAIRGMVESLDDTYSNYVEPDYFPFVDDNLSGAIEGIGVVITENEDTSEIEVVNVLKGTPAEQNGIEEGDAFITVNGEDAIGMTFLELASRVRGPAGTTVDITMRRGDELIDFTIERAHIDIPNVEYKTLDGGIGYISMAQFTATARDQVDDALAALDVNSLNGLILDLRGNPGGLLSTATEIAGLFLDNDVILIEDFGDEQHTFRVEDGAVYESLGDNDERLYSRNAENAGISVPVVVLIDERSASASEVVAGAWQDNGSVTLVGVTSFGKGTVQVQSRLINGGGVRLTVARWLTPNGNWISGQGVTPDIVVEIPEDADLSNGEDPQLSAALDFLTSAVTVQE